MELRIRSSLRFVVAGAIVLSASCSFPEVTFDTTPGSGGGGNGGAASTTTGGGGSGGNGGSTGGGTSTSTSAGGSGGGATTSSSTSSMGGGGGTTCVEDSDNDTFTSWCMGGPDCADQDITANPDADFDSASIQGETKPNTDPFDRNCDGKVERETAVLECGQLIMCGNAEGYQEDVECGQFGVLGHCVQNFGCKWEALSPTVMKQQKCK